MTVLYEDNHIIIVNKTNSEIVQGDKTGDIPLSETIKEWLRTKYNKPGNVFVGVAHRLDRPVSGVVVFAKTSKALTRLNEMFRNGTCKKTYWAIVAKGNYAPQATITHHLVRNEKQNKSVAHNSAHPNSKEASLSYKTLSVGNNFSLLEIDLHTGRHHQIRCQLASIGATIKGDLKYGAPRSNPNGGISLHAHSIAFTHPVSQLPIEVTAPTPQGDIWEQLTPDEKK